MAQFQQQSSRNVCVDCGLNLSDDALPKDQALWNTLAMAVFAVLTCVFFVIIWKYYHYDATFISRFGWFDLTILSLGTFRIIRLLTYDKIFGFVRNFFLDEHTHEGVAPVFVKPAGGWRRLMAELLECIWCTGLWAALGLCTIYMISPLGWFVAVILALSAVGAFLQNMSKLISSVTKIDVL
jgi:hypothetical protein